MHPLDRGLLALSTALPEVTATSVADWPLGQRNRALLELYASAFGRGLQGWAECAKCGEKMEFELDTLQLAEPANSVGGDRVQWDGECYRLPTTRDLAEASREKTEEAATSALVRRCRDGGADRALSAEEILSLGEALAAADPLAEVRVSLTCPVCESHAEETIDPVSFLWSQLEARARRVFWEIHHLATAYGWNEREILSLSPARRAQYLAMVQA